MDASELFADGIPGDDQYDVEGEVGHGLFSEVYKARDKATGSTVALKNMSLSEPGQLPRHVQREVAALQAIQHPNVISLLGSHRKGLSVALVLEYCLTDLYKLLKLLGGTPLEPALAKTIMQQLLRAIHACHQAGFMHRDVAPTNLLVCCDSGLLKLTDFGQARRCPGTPADGNQTAANGSVAAAAVAGSGPSGGASSSLVGDKHSGCLTPTVGTRWYKAPELLFGSRTYTPAIDVWSAGCVFAELLTGQPLFPGSGDIDQVCRHMQVLGSISEERWPGVKELPDWGKLVFPARSGKGWAAVLPGAAPSAVQLMEGLMQYNPEHRLSAEEALQSAYFQEEPAPAPPEALAVFAQQLLSRPREHHMPLPTVSSDEEEDWGDI